MQVQLCFQLIRKAGNTFVIKVLRYFDVFFFPKHRRIARLPFGILMIQRVRGNLFDRIRVNVRKIRIQRQNRVLGNILLPQQTKYRPPNPVVANRDTFLDKFAGRKGFRLGNCANCMTPACAVCDS